MNEKERLVFNQQYPVICILPAYLIEQHSALVLKGSPGKK